MLGGWLNVVVEYGSVTRGFMAKKKKGPRMLVGLKCSETGRVNYITSRNKVNTTEKLRLMKYSPELRKKTLHVETSKLK